MHDAAQSAKPTPAQAAYMAASMAPIFATADAAGQAGRMPGPNETLQQGLLAPGMSMRENLDRGNYLDTGLQGLGLLGDAAYAIPLAGPAIAGALKAPRAISQVAKAAKASNVPEDVARLQFYGDSNPQQLAEGTSRTFSTTGKYRGAPAGTNSPQKLSSIRRRLKDYAERGADYRNWYEETNEFVKQQTASRPGRQDQYAATAAITSQGTSVPANATMAMKGYNQAIVGDAIETGRFPSTMGPAIEEIFSGASPALGPKREPFYQALNQQAGRARQTNDIRQARAFGYKNADGSTFDGGLSDAQHRFMDEETNNLLDYALENKLGGKDDWNKDSLQAAIWIAQKAEEEGTTIAEAGRMFQDFTPQAIIRTEAAPSASLGHLGGLLSDPQALADYSRTQDELMQTPGNLDFITAQSGAMSSPTYQGQGIYEGASNPGAGIPVSVGKYKTDDSVIDPVTGAPVSATIIDPASRKLVEANAAMQGLLRAQDTVGYTSITKAPNAASRNALEVDLGRTITRDELLSLEKKIIDKFGDNLILLHTRKGVSVVTPHDGALQNIVAGTPAKKTPAWQKDLVKIVNESLPVKKTEFGLNTGRLVGDTENWTYRPSQYLGPLEAVSDEMQGLLGKGAAKIAPELERLDSALVEQIPRAGERNIIVTRTRAALEKGGIPEVRKLVDQGVLPALVGGVLLGGSVLPAATDRQPGGLL